MNAKNKKAGDIVSETSIDELLRTAGISLARWARELLYTDAAYSEGWIEEVVEQMETLSYLAHVFIHERPDVPRNVEIDLPGDVYGVVAVNPLRKHSMDEDDEISPPSSHERGDSIPF